MVSQVGAKPGEPIAFQGEASLDLGSYTDSRNYIRLSYVVLLAPVDY